MLNHRLRARWADPAFRAARGHLSDEQLTIICGELRTGKTYLNIAIDWLITEARVAQIAKRFGLQRRVHG